MRASAQRIPARRKPGYIPRSMASEPLPTSALNSATTRVLIKARESLLDRLLPSQDEDASFHEQVDFTRKGRLLVASSFLLAFAELLFATLTSFLDDNWQVTVALLSVTLPLTRRFHGSSRVSTVMSS